MSIKQAINHIHEELALLEGRALAMPGELYDYALEGIRREIERLHDHVSDILHVRMPPSLAGLAAKAPPVAQNAAVAGDEAGHETDNLVLEGPVSERID